MARILLLYATREGQTEKVARFIADSLSRDRQKVHLLCVADDETQSIRAQTYDLFVFGASMHAGGLEKELLEFIGRHRDLIELRPRSLFLVLLSVATRDPALKAKSVEDATAKMRSGLPVE